VTAVLSTLDRGRQRSVPALRRAVDRLDPTCRLVASYHLGWCDPDGKPVQAGGGKAIRPALALLAAEAVGAPADVAVPGAVAVELIHNFSLLHDDVLDADTERRHRPTVWAVWDTATAILTGDALVALAHEVLLEADVPDARQASWLLATVTRELTRGQVQDLAFQRRADVGLQECLDMAAAKTASLLGASTAIGAVLAGAAPETVAALRNFGTEFGLAFQLVDDVLGIWGDPAVTGKPVYSDLRARKKTLPVSYLCGSADPPAELATWLADSGEPDARQLGRLADALLAGGARDWALDEARRRLERAEHALTGVALEPSAHAELLALARYVVERDS
jgi:geranylgeranyl diphosphate synthase, type I